MSAGGSVDDFIPQTSIVLSQAQQGFVERQRIPDEYSFLSPSFSEEEMRRGRLLGLAALVTTAVFFSAFFQATVPSYLLAYLLAVFVPTGIFYLMAKRMIPNILQAKFQEWSQLQNPHATRIYTKWLSQDRGPASSNYLVDMYPEGDQLVGSLVEIMPARGESIGIHSWRNRPETIHWRVLKQAVFNVDEEEALLEWTTEAQEQAHVLQERNSRAAQHAAELLNGGQLQLLAG